MVWCWQQTDWPNFIYKTKQLEQYEAEFHRQSGICFGAFTHITEDEQLNLNIELISEEALKTSKIEGEDLNRDSIQISICRHFGLETDNRRILAPEAGIAAMLVELFHNFSKPLTHDSLFHWHTLLMSGRSDLKQIGAYRNEPVPTQIVSGPMHNPKVHYEAPPAKQINSEMSTFIKWFNRTTRKQKNALPSLIHAGIAHLYFVNIHPFEDGNGRIARALAEKSLAQSQGKPSLIALAYTIERNRKEYYQQLARTNKTCKITDWLEYFSETTLQAQLNTIKRIEFIVNKNKFFRKFAGQLNNRQEKVLLRMFKEGIDGFKGGLSAINYIAISKATASTATRDLQDLVTKGALTKQGELRYSRYFLNV
jgi:Fic family protein